MHLPLDKTLSRLHWHLHQDLRPDKCELLDKLYNATLQSMDALCLCRAELDIYRLISRAPAGEEPGRLDPAAFVEAGTAAIANMPQVDRGCLVLFRDNSDQLVFLQTIRMVGRDPTDLMEQVCPKTICRVRETGEEVQIQFTVNGEDHQAALHLRRQHVKTILCCPIPHGNHPRPIGVLYLESHQPPVAFPEPWLRVVRHLVTRIGEQLSPVDAGEDSSRDLTTAHRRERPFAEIIGRSRHTAVLLGQINHILDHGGDRTILISGETGVGKDLVARALHRYGRRRMGPYVAVNCAAIPVQIAEAEFFGTVRGAFTEARDRDGLFHQAEGGVLFLDEVGQLHPETQAKLLRVLDDGMVRRVGARTSTKIDFWLLAATNTDLWQAVESGRFRRDLYFRLFQCPIEISPLRERPDDVEALVEHFVRETSIRVDKPVSPLSPELILELRSRPWPGNVRELQVVCEALCMNARGQLLTIEDLRVFRAAIDGRELPRSFHRWDTANKLFQERYLRLAVERWGPAQARIASRLGVHRTHLYRLCKKYGIDMVK